MSWRDIAETTQRSGYSLAGNQLVQRMDGQLQAMKEFLVESEGLAASDPSLAKMRTDIEDVYNNALETLDHIGQQDLEAVGDFYAVGAISQVSVGLKLFIDHTNPTSGRAIIGQFHRLSDLENSEEALAIEDPQERRDFVAENRESWANSDRLRNYKAETEVLSSFAEASLEARKNEIDPSYQPDPNKSFEAIAAMGENGRRMMTMSIYGDEDILASDPVDYEAMMLYKNMNAMRFADALDNAGEVMTPEMQVKLQEINMTIIARTLNGEYGETIRIPQQIDDEININDVDPRIAMRTLANSAGVTFNPLRSHFSAYDVYGDVDDDFKLPNEGHIGDFVMGDFRAEQDQFSDRLERISDLVDASDGQRISLEEFYTALDKDPAGPNFNLPTPRVYANIQRSIGSIEERISVLEELVADPEGANFQDALAKHEMSIESLMLGLKGSMASHNYAQGLESQTYEALYTEGNFDARMEALLGVPMNQSKNMTLEGSPLLQAFEKNFHAFHRPDAAAEDIPEIRDGSSQLGASLSTRGGAVVLDEHSQAEPVQFLYDSLPEISSYGSTIVLIENAASFIPQGGLVDLTKTYNPISKFYETGDPSHLDTLKSHLTLKLEQKEQNVGLTDEEQLQLAELQDRDALQAKLIKEGYTDYGVKFQFFGGGAEGTFADEFGSYARMVTTNAGWDDKINAAGEGYDNVIIWAGGGHFVEGIMNVEVGKMGLDESLGYPTFSLSNPGGLLRGAGDYNLAPTESGRWVSTDDPLAHEATNIPTVMPDGPTVSATPSPH